MSDRLSHVLRQGVKFGTPQPSIEFSGVGVAGDVSGASGIVTLRPCYRATQKMLVSSRDS